MSQETGGTRELVQETSVESAESVAELRQQFAQLKGLLAQQQAELVELRGRIATSYGAAKARAGVSSQRSGHASSRASSRRSLLKWGGATAAAAAVALAAGEQAAHAQPRSDGSAISAGNVTTAEHATTLKFDGTSGNAKVLFLAHDTSFHASDAKYPAALGGWVDGATSGNTTGVYGYSEASGGYGIVGVASGIGILGTSSEDNGVYATTTNTNGQAALAAINNGSSVGVYAQSNDDALGSPAIQAVANGKTGDGIDAYGATNGNGVYGVGDGAGGYGVWGITDAGFGVVAQSTTGISLAAVGSNRILQGLQGFFGTPTSGSYLAGEQLRDESGDLYICVLSGSPGTWKKVAAIPSGASGGASVFFATPYRIFDTRGLSGVPLNNGVGNHPMNPTQIIPLQITGTVDPLDSSIVVPTGATGIIGNLIAIAPSGEGFLGIQPSTGAANSRAWVNYEANVSIDNAVLVGLSTNGKVDIQCSTAKAGAALTITGYII